MKKNQIRLLDKDFDWMEGIFSIKRSSLWETFLFVDDAELILELYKWDPYK